MLGFRLFLLLFFTTGSAQAKDLCTLFRNSTPLPTWYNTLCTGGSGFDGLKSVVGGAYSTFADAFSLNPASLPTVALPPGVEVIASAPTGTGLGSSHLSFNAIKGFSGVGAGFGADSNNSIFSNRGNRGVAQSSAYSPGPSFATLNFGGAVALDQFLNKTSPSSWIPKLGAVMRYNSDVKNWSPGLGLASNLGPFSLGGSAIFEKAVNYFPSATVFTGSLGIHLFRFQADYTVISNITSMYTSTLSLIALSGNIGGFTVNGAARYDSSSSASSAIYHFGLQYVFSVHLALAYLYNYIPGYQSISTQIMF